MINLPGEIVNVGISHSHKDVVDGNFFAEGGFVVTANEPEGTRKWFPCYESYGVYSALRSISSG